MRILLDHCVKKQVALHLGEHEVVTAYSLGWHELRNGKLLREADSNGFEILVTVDKNMPFQSSLKGLNLTVAVLDVQSNLVEDLIEYAGIFLSRLDTLERGAFNWIRHEES